MKTNLLRYAPLILETGDHIRMGGLPFKLNYVEPAEWKYQPSDSERRQAIAEEARENTRRFLDRKFKK